MSERPISEQINEAYRTGLNEGLHEFFRNKISKFHPSGFSFKHHQVFLESREGFCECETGKIAIELRELVFARITIVKPSFDLTYFDYCDKDPIRGIKGDDPL